MGRNRRAIGNALAAAIIVVILVAAVGASYYASNTTSRVTVTSTSLSTVTTTVISTAGGTVSNVADPFAPSADVVAAAQREGTLSISSAAPQVVFEKNVWPLFVKLYPWAKLQYFSTDTATLFSKALGECQANKPTSDVFVNNFNYLIQLKQNNCTAPKTFSFLSQYYPSSSYDPEGYWYANGALLMVLYYNTNLVSDSQAPKSYWDLTTTQWNGKIGLDKPSNYQSFGGSMTTLYPILGQEAWTKLVSGIAKNNPKFYNTGSSVFTGVSSGDVPVGIGYFTDIVRNPKAPVKVVFLQPTAFQPVTFAIAKGAPHPNMAELFIRFSMSMQGELSNEASGFVSPGAFDTPLAMSKVVPPTVTTIRVGLGVSPDPNLNLTPWTDLLKNTMGCTGC